MNTESGQEMQALKSRLKTTWETGDFSKVAEHIEDAAQDFVDRLDLKPGMKVLDVACGSGNLAIFAAETGADVTGLDIAANLIEAAGRRAAEHGVTAKLDVGDAEAMPYPDNWFDVVMTMYGAMFCPRPDVAASELIRVCKPGGMIAMANWTPTGFVGQMFKIGAKYLPPPNMPPPVLWGVPETIAERLGDRVTYLTTSLRFAEMTFDVSPVEVVEFFKTYFGPTIMAFKAMSEEDRKSCTADLVAHWEANNQGEPGRTLTKSEFLDVRAIKK
jgi:ubiquinone/menaquinone biosynthesis C-methylase UbiE